MSRSRGGRRPQLSLEVRELIATSVGVLGRLILNVKTTR